MKISDYANSGCYCFKSCEELMSYCGKIIDAGEMQLSQDMKGEFYTSGVIKAMLDDGIECKMIPISKECMHVLGTPSQLIDALHFPLLFPHGITKRSSQVSRPSLPASRSGQCFTGSTSASGFEGGSDHNFGATLQEVGLYNDGMPSHEWGGTDDARWSNEREGYPCYP